MFTLNISTAGTSDLGSLYSFFCRRLIGTLGHNLSSQLQTPALGGHALLSLRGPGGPG